MRNTVGGMCLLMTLAISLLAAASYADETTTLKRTVTPSRYDVSKEVTLEGTVQTLVRKPAAGSIIGAHLMVSTAQGTVDAHIGNRLFSGGNPTSFSSGQAVKLVGIMTKFNGQDVFLVRTIQTGGSTITVRNEHGFLVTPNMAKRLAEVSAAGGAR